MASGNHVSQQLFLNEEEEEDFCAATATELNNRRKAGVKKEKPYKSVLNKSAAQEPEIAVIHDHIYYYDDLSANSLLGEDNHLCNSISRPKNLRRNYIPSPLSTPRRMTRKLGDQITNSPILSRARKRFESPEVQQRPPQPQQQQQPVMAPTSSSSKSAGFLSFLTSVITRRPSSSSKSKNLFLDPKMHDDFYEDGGIEMHQFSDSGRIANRYDNKRWDVWTTMGENVLEYDGVLFDEGDPYYDEEDECSSSSDDDFLEIPLNDRSKYKH